MTRLDPARFLSDPPLAAIWNALPEARIVGGAVRDALAGRAIADIDFATPRTPDAVSRTLQEAGIRTIPTGLAHGTVTAALAGKGFEITTLRRDVETDGRHAVVAFTEDWRQDASRRDFTINAMSLARDGNVFDYFGGVDDLAAQTVRFVGDPSTRIQEDYLRILRFFRFYARYGGQDPDPVTRSALATGVAGLRVLSIERVWNELRLILGTPDPAASVALMRRLGIWLAVLPEAGATADLARLPADPILRLAAMLTGDPLRLAARMRIANEDRDRLLRLLSVPAVQAAEDDAALRRLLAQHDRADLIARTWLDDPPQAASLRERLAAMPQPVFPLEGRDVLALGVAPGRAVGMLLRAVRHWWLDGGCVADAAACRQELVGRIAAGEP